MMPYGFHWICLGCGARLNATTFPVQCPQCHAVYGVQHVVGGPNLPPGILAPMPRPTPRPEPSLPFADPEPADMTEEQRRTAHRLLAEAFDG